MLCKVGYVNSCEEKHDRGDAHNLIVMSAM